jgi:NTE family protein
MSEIAFNASLASEMRAIHFVNRLIEKGALNQERYRKVFVHRIEAEDEMRPLGSATKLLIEPEFLQRLFGFGRAAADTWLQTHVSHLGRESTVNIPSMYLAHK